MQNINVDVFLLEAHCRRMLDYFNLFFWLKDYLIFLVALVKILLFKQL